MTCSGPPQLHAWLARTAAGEGAPPGPELEAHLEGCAECRRLVAQLAVLASSSAGAEPSARPATVRVLAPGTRVDRFEVQALLGAGAMGVVYRANDPRLERAVALKVLRLPEGADEVAASERLEREARAMAKLSHPSVLTVYEVGHLGAQVFLALELVRGGTLRAWLASPKPRREALQVLLQAGEGLAAAHRAGLVHRDFKPENVLLGEDGAVKVADFGLAEHAQTPVEPGGTLAYMAPEQRSGAAPSPLADQYAFCVTALEVLAGTRSLEIATKRLPRAWVAVVRRGLAETPEQRYPTMEALLAALRRVAGARARWLLGAGIGALLASLAALVVLAPKARACEGGDALVAEVWSPARRAALKTVFVASPNEAVASTWPAFSAAVDDFTSQWALEYRAACEAAKARGPLPTSSVDARQACLEERLLDVRGLLAAVAGHGDATLWEAPDAVLRLPALARCGANGLVDLGTVSAPPAELAATWLEARAELAELRARHDLGDVAPAAKGLEALEARMTPLGGSALLAEIGVVRVRALGNLRDYDAAERHAFHTFALATKARQPLTAFDVALLGAKMATRTQSLAPERWLELAEGTFPEGRLPLPRLVELLEAKAYVLGRANRPGDALEAVQKAWELQQTLPAERDVLRADATLRTLSESLRQMGRHEEALARARELLEVRERRLGPSHPQTITASTLVADALLALGRVAEAEPLARRRVEAEALFRGEGHHAVLTARLFHAECLSWLGRHEEALGLARPAVERLRALGQPGPLGPGLVHLAFDLVRAGHAKEAEPIAREAIAVVGTSNPVTRQAAREALLRAVLDLNRPREALPLARELVLESGSASPLLRASLQVLLARALVDGPEAAALRAEARGIAERAGGAGHHVLAELGVPATH